MVLFQYLLWCRGVLRFIKMLGGVGRCPLCVVSFLVPWKSLQNAHEGLKKSALSKRNKPDMEEDRRKADWTVHDYFLARRLNAINIG